MARPNVYKNGTRKKSYRMAGDAVDVINAYAQKHNMTEARAASELIMKGAKRVLKLAKGPAAAS